MTLFEQLLAMYAGAALIIVGVIAWANRKDGDDLRLFQITAVATLSWVVVVLARLVVPWWTAKQALLQFDPILRWASLLAWLVFFLHYTNRDHLLTPRVKLGLWAIFGLHVAVYLTTHLHGLGYEYAPGAAMRATEPIPHLQYARGPFYWASFALAVVAMLYVTWLLLTLAYHARRDSHRQALALVAGVLAPFAITIMGPAAVFDANWIRYLALGSAIQWGLVGWALYGGEFLNVRPVDRAAIMEAVDDPILVVTDDCRLADYDSTAARYFPGIDGSIGESLSSAAPRLVGDATPEEIAARLVETIDVSVDGEERSLVVDRSAFIDDGSGQHVIVLRDVTEIEAHAADLEQQTEQLDRFASVVSHDLRNPLAVAEGRLQALAPAIDDEDLRTHLEEIGWAHDRMQQIIEDALTLAREGRAIEETESTPLARVVREAWSSAGTGSANLSMAVDDGVRIEADGSRLRTLLENLLRNAVDHGPDDVTATVGTTEDGFYVEDDGPGIPPGELERVFDHGYTTDDDGTGLGLAIVESIAEAHGWTVSVTESDTGGARFEFAGVSEARPKSPTFETPSPCSAKTGEG